MIVMQFHANTAPVAIHLQVNHLCFTIIVILKDVQRHLGTSNQFYRELGNPWVPRTHRLERTCHMHRLQTSASHPDFELRRQMIDSSGRCVIVSLTMALLLAVSFAVVDPI